MTQAETATAEKPAMRLIDYRKPTLSGPRGMSILALSDIMTVIVQTLAPGARQGLHAHEAYDGFYFVLGGRARFYSGAEDVFAEIGTGQGVFVPRGTPYAFEAVGGEAQLLSIDAIDKRVADVFTSYEDGSDAVDYEFFAPDGTLQQAKRWTADDGVFKE
jgi:mannose-6-phosphate isomerase-like protein (cupin superfamily)